VFVGEADDIARELWAVVHGITSLVIADMLELGDARERLAHLYEVCTAGYRQEATQADAAR